MSLDTPSPPVLDLRIVRSRGSGSLRPRRKRIACILLLSGFLGCPAGGGHAAGLECPETGPRAVPSLLADSERARLMTTGNSTDLANEIYDAINRLQIEQPNISYTDMTNVLIAAYCPLVANASQLTAAEKWQRMRQFDAILRQQLAADSMPQGSLIIANVPLPPAVYRELRSQAAAANQTPAQFMAAILARAAVR
jgi:hypothetical protein